MTTNKKAHDAVVRARTQLVVREPFFGALALQLNIVEVKMPTMATDGVCLYYDPKFVLDLTEEQLVGVNAHEVMHCALSHMSRRGHRDPLKWNAACDFRVNADLKKVPFELPYKPATLKEFLAAKPGQTFHLFDPQFEHMSTEEIYEKIPDLPGQGGGGLIVIDIGGCGAVLDAGSGPGNPDAQGQPKPSAEQVAHEWQANVRMAVSVARANNAGQTPGYLERLVSQLKRPKVSWRDLTQQFIDQSFTIDYSYRHPNRRYLSAGLILPGTVPDALHKMVMFIDCSGSISDEMMRSYVSEVAGALGTGTCDELVVVYADDGVRHVDRFTPGDIVTCKTLGSGGTNFDDSFEWLTKNEPDAACAIYLTDMETGSFGKEPSCPVLWGVYTTEDRFQRLKPPFGSMILVEGPH